jgi:secretion/DNA translocation related TadE-like protein
MSDDRGTATVVAAAVIAILMTLVSLGVHLGAAVVTRHRVTAAADLAALAAAGQLLTDGERACERARWVAERMGGRLTACRVVGWDAYVDVSATPPGWLALSGAANAHVRAGPAEAPDSG